MLEKILLIAAIAYTIEMIVFAAAVLNARYPMNRTPRPAASIIIAARNEEHNIRQCLDSILRLSYPRHLLEVIVVDDRSTDATQRIVREFTTGHPFITLVVTQPETGVLRGKTNAVTHGIEASKGEILLFTDADCVVPPHWVEEIAKYYTDESVGIVAGFTSLRGKNWFESMQALDWFVLFSVAAATIRLRYPVTAVGNNLSVRRKAYDAVGGYRKIPFSVTEDYALFHAITSSTEYSARFPIDKESLVESIPCQSWKELYGQKKRWFTGGLDMDTRSFLVFGVAYALNVLLWVTPFVSGVQALWIPLLLKLCADFALALPSLIVFKRLHLASHFLHFQLYYIVYVLVFPLVALLGREVIWKERTFKG